MHPEKEEKLYRLAQKRVKQKKGFFKHLQAFVLVNVALFFLTVFEGEPFESIPVTILWGIGLAFHYVNVFGMPGGKLSDEWEDRQTEKEFQKLKDRYARGRGEIREDEFDLDLDSRLDLRETRKQTDYDERDFV